jgi:FkbM family methyltransferase
MSERENIDLLNFDGLARAYSATTDDFLFIQVGANDGRIGDPLFGLVTEYGWRGILVEPQQYVYEKRLVPNYAGHDRLYFENVAIDRQEGQRKLYKLSFSQERWATGLASFKKSHLEKHIAEGYIERMIGDERNRLPASKTEYICSEIVTTMTFNTLLDKYRIENLDLLQIDTEGYDYTLLQLFDFARLRPSIIQFEHHVMTDQERNDSLNLLHSYDYLTFFEHINIVAFRKELSEEIGIVFDSQRDAYYHADS